MSINVGDAVKVQQGTFAIKGKVGEVVKVVGERVMVKFSETQMVMVLEEQLEVVSQLELVRRQMAGIARGK